MIGDKYGAEYHRRNALPSLGHNEAAPVNLGQPVIGKRYGALPSLDNPKEKEPLIDLTKGPGLPYLDRKNLYRLYMDQQGYKNPYMSVAEEEKMNMQNRQRQEQEAIALADKNTKGMFDLLIANDDKAQTLIGNLSSAQDKIRLFEQQNPDWRSNSEATVKHKELENHLNAAQALKNERESRVMQQAEQMIASGQTRYPYMNQYAQNILDRRTKPEENPPNPEEAAAKQAEQEANAEARLKNKATIRSLSGTWKSKVAPTKGQIDDILKKNGIDPNDTEMHNSAKEYYGSQVVANNAKGDKDFEEFMRQMQKDSAKFANASQEARIKTQKEFIASNPVFSENNVIAMATYFPEFNAQLPGLEGKSLSQMGVSAIKNWWNGRDKELEQKYNSFVAMQKNNKLLKEDEKGGKNGDKKNEVKRVTELTDEDFE
jgi:hypothetical protein